MYLNRYHYLLLVLVVTTFSLGLNYFSKLNDFLHTFQEISNYGEVSYKIESSENISTSTNEKNQINFVGDVMLARHVEYLMTQYGNGYPFKNIDFLNPKESYIVGNFESSIPIKHVKTPNFNFRFSVHKKYLTSLSEVGFTHMSLANNHAFDYGYEGYKNAKLELKNNNIFAFGQPNDISTSSVVFITLPHNKISITAINTVSGLVDDEKLKEVLDFAKSDSDTQIIFIHWGEEYNSLQSKSQRLLATRLSELGVDIIVGHHPHVVQGIEKINDTIVFYSLGNFIFDQYFNTEVRQGFVVNLTENPKFKLELSIIPVTSEHALAQPKLMTEEERKIFLTRLAKNSDSNMEEKVLFAKFNLHDLLATSTETAIIAE